MNDLNGSNPISRPLIHEQVARQAGLTPHALALSNGSINLSFKELDDRSLILADTLRALGIHSESLVGVCAKRSVAMIIAALGILKAGGAYLPLDPLNPAARLLTLTEDAGISVLVTTKDTEHKISVKGRPTLVLDDAGRIIDAPAPSGGPATPALAAARDLAYVIYTSGSTGQPNGVEVTHENLLNLIFWHHQAFQVTPADRTSQIASVGFDAAVWEIWPCLAAGGSIHIPDEQIIRDPEALRDWLVSERITISFVAAPMAENLLRLQWPTHTALRMLLTGADTLHLHPPAGLPFQLINNYGPTECTVVATSGLVPKADSKNALPPIGFPIANTQAYILDDAGMPVTAGSEGQLHIGGAGVARGYRKRPELTAKRFIPDPFFNQPHGRLFKTGDIARLLPDGQLAFVRRMDDQVKVRGFRVEPDEVAAALSRHPRVAQSAVVVRQLEETNHRLVAYVVFGPEGPIAPGELIDFLRLHLPDYMIPDLFVKLDSLPLSTNGKVSRSDLPEPGEQNILQDVSFTAPRTETEKVVADILAGLLGVKQVDVEANFFALGAHSLVGAQLIARIRRTYGLEMSLRVLFAGPTVAKLCLEIERLVALKNAGPQNHQVRSVDEPQAPAGIGRKLI